MAMEATGDTSLVPIGAPNYRAIGTMPPQQLFKTREMWISKFCTVWRAQESDSIKQASEWIVALTSEMRLRGGSVRGGI